MRALLSRHFAVKLILPDLYGCAKQHLYENSIVKIAVEKFCLFISEFSAYRLKFLLHMCASMYANRPIILKYNIYGERNKNGDVCPRPTL